MPFLAQLTRFALLLVFMGIFLLGRSHAKSNLQAVSKLRGQVFLAARS